MGSRAFLAVALLLEAPHASAYGVRPLMSAPAHLWATASHQRAPAIFASEQPLSGKTDEHQPLPVAGGDASRAAARRARGVATTLAVCAAGLFGSSPLFARPAAAQEVAAPALKPLSGMQQKRLMKMLKSKLAKVPVFMVTNEGGSPFLNKLATGDQSALMFLFPGEAERMLEGVLKAPNGASSGAKVLATNLDRAFKLARLDPMPSGLRDQYSNRELTMVWQFMPHAAEQRAAQVQERRAFLSLSRRAATASPSAHFARKLSHARAHTRTNKPVELTASSRLSPFALSRSSSPRAASSRRPACRDTWSTASC
jgi:hypothetical protein